MFAIGVRKVPLEATQGLKPLPKKVLHRRKNPLETVVFCVVVIHWTMRLEGRIEQWRPKPYWFSNVTWTVSLIFRVAAMNNS